MSRKAAKNSQTKPKKPKKANLYTPTPVRGRVIARHINGDSNRSIAREEQLDRATVSRILSQREAIELVAEYQSRLLSLTPKAIDVYEDALDSADLRLALPPATKVLQRLGKMEQTLIDMNRALPDSTSTEPVTPGQVIRGLLEIATFRRKNDGLKCLV